MKQLQLYIPCQKIQILVMDQCILDVHQDSKSLKVLFLVRIKFVNHLREIEKVIVETQRAFFFHWRIQEFGAIQNLQLPIFFIMEKYFYAREEFKRGSKAVPKLARTFRDKPHLPVVLRKENNDLVLFGEFVRSKDKCFR